MGPLERDGRFIQIEKSVLRNMRCLDMEENPWEKRVISNAKVERNLVCTDSSVKNKAIVGI